MTRAFRWTIRAGAVLMVLAAIVVLVVLWLWRQRSAPEDLSWPVADSRAETLGAVTVTWLGITTLLFDDGETQILIDGTFTRLSPLDILLQRKVRSDIATINYAMDEFRIERLAAIVPVHSHFDHAMDSGNVANRSTAIILGSESVANIARGAGVPVDQYQILADGEVRVFGDFTITLLRSAHVPSPTSAQGWFAGVIDQPLEQPARIASWRGGATNSVLIEHPAGSALVQGSAGFVENQFADVEADVILLSVAGLAAMGEEYTNRYWQETVTASGAKRALMLHWDDFARPFGEIYLLPDIADGIIETAGWIDAAASDSDVIVESRAHKLAGNGAADRAR